MALDEYFDSWEFTFPSLSGIYNSPLPIIIITNCSGQGFMRGNVVVMKEDTGNW